MRNKTGIVALAALGTLCLAGHAFANDDDCNRDGDPAIGYDDEIDRHVESRLQVQVADFDAEGDRGFDEDRFQRRRLARAFRRLDINDDGVLARWELRRSWRFRRQFHRLDRNEDGVIARWEFRRAFRGDWR